MTIDAPHQKYDERERFQTPEPAPPVDRGLRVRLLVADPIILWAAKRKAN